MLNKSPTPLCPTPPTPPHLCSKLLQPPNVNGPLLRGVEVAPADTEVTGGADHPTGEAKGIVGEDGFGCPIVVLGMEGGREGEKGKEGRRDKGGREGERERGREGERERGREGERERERGREGERERGREARRREGGRERDGGAAAQGKTSRKVT